MSNITDEQYKEALDIIEKYNSLQEKHITKTCCVCKHKEIKSMYPIKYNKLSNGLWNNGIVSKIQAGFGSDYDMDTFLIAICDDCITDLISNNLIEKVNGRN